jgi:hypothetical protein
MMVVLRELLFCRLLIKQRRRVRPLHFLHEVFHQLLAETVKRTPGKLVAFVFHHVGLCLMQSVDIFVDLLWLFIIILSLLDGGRHGIGLQLNIFLNLIFLILNSFAFELVSCHVD